MRYGPGHRLAVEGIAGFESRSRVAVVGRSTVLAAGYNPGNRSIDHYSLVGRKVVLVVYNSPIE